MGFQGEIRPKRLICYSNTVRPQYRLDNWSQWPENRTLHCNPLRDFSNFCHHISKWSEIPHAQAFFTSLLRTSLCESCSTSQTLLAHSGPHPPHTMSPDPCSDFSSSFDPFQPQSTPYCSQSPGSCSRSIFIASTLLPLLPPSFSSAGLHHPSQPPSPACA